MRSEGYGSWFVCLSVSLCVCVCVCVSTLILALGGPLAIQAASELREPEK